MNLPRPIDAALLVAVLLCGCASSSNGNSGELDAAKPDARDFVEGFCTYKEKCGLVETVEGCKVKETITISTLEKPGKACSVAVVNAHDYLACVKDKECSVWLKEPFDSDKAECRLERRLYEAAYSECAESSVTPPKDAGDDDDDDNGACKTDRDCPSPFKCRDKICILVECETDEDCGEGKQCVKYQCSDSPPPSPDAGEPDSGLPDASEPDLPDTDDDDDTKCRVDRDCRLAEYCLGGQCIPEGGACSKDSDCEDSFECIDGRCIPYWNYRCYNDDDCGGSRIRCKLETGLCIQCIWHSDCGEGKVCENDLCKPAS